jgi:hypothetical protein
MSELSEVPMIDISGWYSADASARKLVVDKVSERPGMSVGEQEWPGD